MNLVNVMVSLHSFPNYLVITSLLDFKITRKIPLPFEAVSFALTCCKSFCYKAILTSALEVNDDQNSKKDGKILSFTLSFVKEEKNKKNIQSLRD